MYYVVHRGVSADSVGTRSIFPTVRKTWPQFSSTMASAENVCSLIDLLVGFIWIICYTRLTYVCIISPLISRREENSKNVVQVLQYIIDYLQCEILKLVEAD